MNDDDQTYGCRPVYPVFLNLAERQCLVVGGGMVALRKTRDLVEAGAVVTVVADHPHPDMAVYTAEHGVRLIERRFEHDDLAGMFVVFAATDDDAVNSTIADAARASGALVNAVDNPPKCDFFSGSVVKRGPLRIAVSTSGCAPGLAARIRREIDSRYDDEWGVYLETIGAIRRHILTHELSHEKKRDLLAWLCEDSTFTLFRKSGQEWLWEEATQRISS